MRDAFMVGLVLAAVWFVEKCLTTPMVFRPIVVGPLVGLVLGDVKMGILCGATLETVFMGAIQVGSAVPPDPMIGAGVGTALAILSGGGPIVAFTLGFPIAIFGQSIKAGEKVTTGKTVTINVKKSNTISGTTAATKSTTSASDATTKAND